MLDDLALFVKVVEAGSLNAAAENLALPASTVTRRLQKLEQQLGCRLLHRSARRNAPTPEGWQYYEQCRPLVHALQQTTRQLDETLNEVKGVVHVLAPLNLANGLLAQAFISFLQAYPHVNLALRLGNYIEDIVGVNADLAIRVGELPDSTLSMRRLGRISKALLVASPSYLSHHPAPQSPSSLNEHDLLVSEPLSIWGLRHHSSGEHFRLTPHARFVSNDFDLSLKAAAAGMGILFCPLTVCHAALEEGTLVRVLPEWHSPPRDVTMVWAQQRYVPARVRKLIEHLVHYAEKIPLLNGEL